MQPLVCRRIGDLDPDEVVRRARHQETRRDFATPPDRGLESIEEIIRLPLKRDLDENDESPFRGNAFDEGGVTADHAGPLQLTHATQASRFRQPDLLGKIGIADPSVDTKDLQNLSIEAVKGGAFCHAFELVCAGPLTIADNSSKTREIARFCTYHRDGLEGVTQMRIGVPKEVKNHEYRVGLTPASVAELVRAGHEVLVETQAGVGIGSGDTEYQQAGGRVVSDVGEVFSEAELIVKVKEPQAVERARLRRGQVLFTYLHLAPDPEQTRDLLRSGATCIAYETVTAERGGLPLLAPMSEVAGRLAPQVGAAALQKAASGRGVLLGGVPGVLPGKVVIIGGGISGTHAAGIALGMGADVTVLDRSPAALKRIAAQFGGAVKTLISNSATIRSELTRADLFIGTVLVPGAEAPKLVTRAMLADMQPGSVIVDVAIDQGGCCETSRATTHADPTYVVDGIVHYCVANMPGAVPRTSALALNAVTLPFVLALADNGWRRALDEDPHLRNGLNVHDGKLTCEPVAVAQGLPSSDFGALAA